MLLQNNFVWKSAAFAKSAGRNNYKLIIQHVNLIFHTKPFTRLANNELKQLCYTKI